MDKKFIIKMRTLRFVKKYKKNTDRHTLVATILLLFLLILIPVWNFFLDQAPSVPEDANDTFTGSFVGDMRFNAYYDVAVAKGRGEEISSPLDRYLGASDFIAGNIIGLTTENEAKLLKDFKFSTVNVFDDPEAANTDVQRADALKTLDKNGIIHVGEDSATRINLVYLEVKGIKIATIAMMESQYATSIPVIEKAQGTADLVIVHLNWENQFSSDIEADERRIAETISDAGADIIVGHNTEVLKPIEIFNDTIILYSLGNFLHGEIYAVTNDSAMVQYVIGKDGSSKSLKIIPLSLTFGRPEPALSIFEGLTRHNIFKILTSELPEESSWSIEESILKIELN